MKWEGEGLLDDEMKYRGSKVVGSKVNEVILIEEEEGRLDIEFDITYILDIHISN